MTIAHPHRPRAGLAALLALCLTPALAPLAAHAAEPSDPEAAAAAADYVLAQVEEDNDLGDSAGMTADAILALVAAGGHDGRVEAMTDRLEELAQGFAIDNGPAAGKLAVVAAATGRDASDFGGVDLISEITGQLQPGGQCGGFGYAFGQALCMVGLERSGAPVPQEVVEHLLTYQGDSGAFGYGDGAGFTADNDATAFSVDALAGVLERPGAYPAVVQARDYLVDAQTDQGYWDSFSPVNSTGLVASALQTVGADSPLTAASAFQRSQQLPDGGLPNTIGGSASDVRATVQGLLVWTGQSLATVGEPDAQPVALGTAPYAARLAGVDRFATAAAAAEVYPRGVPVAYVASGETFPDALAGSALAGLEGAPVLLTEPGEVPLATQEALSRLEPERIVVLGGQRTVHDTVKESLSAFTAGEVARLAGDGREETSARIAEQFETAELVYVATGATYADALAASARAGQVGAPVLLVTRTEIDASVRAQLERLAPQQIVVLGGDASVGTDSVVAELQELAPTRVYGGDDRYDTAALLAQEYSSAEAALATTGRNWPDALSGGATAAQLSVPLLLVDTDGLPSPTAQQLKRLQPQSITVVGGEMSVTGTVLTALDELVYGG